MRATHAFLPWLLLAACAPPVLEQAGGSPQIRIVHPPPGESTVVQLNADCTLDLLVVVAIDNFEVRAPADADEAVLGGHWHAEVDGRADEVRVANGDLFAEVTLTDTTAIAPQAEIQIEVDLRDDQHQVLDGFSEDLTEDDIIVVVGAGDCVP